MISTFDKSSSDVIGFHVSVCVGEWGCGGCAFSVWFRDILTGLCIIVLDRLIHSVVVLNILSFSEINKSS